MIRALYRCLLLAHPPRFRRAFADDMLWLYDETVPAGMVPLLLDGIASVLRQWMLRSGSWKVVAALLGALFQVGLGGVLWVSMGTLRIPPTLTAVEHPELVALMRLAALTSVGLFGAVIFLIFWWRRLARLRGI
jgi:hypothetical protein